MSFNNRSFPAPSQVRTGKTFPSTQVQFGDIPGHIIADPVKAFEAWYAARRQVMNGLIDLQSNRGPGFSLSRHELAQICGVHKSTVDKELRVLQQNELIWTPTGSDGNKTFFVNPWFYDPRLKPLLIPIFKALRYLSAIGLVITPQSIESRNLQTNTKFPYKRVYGYIYTQNRDITEHLDRVRDTSLITELQLTTQGRIRLSVFPQEALEHANDQLKWATRVKNRFAWFWTCCKNWCRDNGIKPALWRVFSLGGSFAHHVPMVMDDDAAVRSAFLVKQQTALRKDIPVVTTSPIPPSRFERSAEDKERFNQDKARQREYDADARADREARERLKKRREWLYKET